MGPHTTIPIISDNSLNQEDVLHLSKAVSAAMADWLAGFLRYLWSVILLRSWQLHTIPSWIHTYVVWTCEVMDKMSLEIWMACVTCQLVRASVSVHESISRNLVSPPNILHTDSSVCNRPLLHLTLIVMTLIVMYVKVHSPVFFWI